MKLYIIKQKLVWSLYFISTFLLFILSDFINTSKNNKNYLFMILYIYFQIEIKNLNNNKLLFKIKFQLKNKIIKQLT